MKSRIFFWSITSALAGFLFGFDTVGIRIGFDPVQCDHRFIQVGLRGRDFLFGGLKVAIGWTFG